MAALRNVSLGASVSQVRAAHALVEEFFGFRNPTLELYYLHNVLTKLLFFRRYYPYGLISNHFGHVNEHQVKVLYSDRDSNDDRRDQESMSTALYDLLPILK